MTEYNIWIFLKVFLCLLALDFAWAKYTQSVHSPNTAARATFYSMITIGISYIITISYVENHWTWIPAMLGGGLGTYIVVKRTKEK